MKRKKKIRLKTGVHIILAAAAAVLLMITWVFLHKNTSEEEPVLTAVTAGPEEKADAQALKTPQEETVSAEPAAEQLIRQPVITETYFKIPYEKENYADSLDSDDFVFSYELNPHDSYTINNISLSGNTSYTIFCEAEAASSSSVIVRVYDGISGDIYFETDRAVEEGHNSIRESFSVSESSNAVMEIQNSSESEKLILRHPFLTCSDPDILVRVSQIGYLSNDEKRCTFAADPGDLFDVINAETEEIVYTGDISQKGYNQDTGEYNSFGEFTSLKDNGTYYIRTQKGQTSYPFDISEDPFDDLTIALLHEFVYQRCGYDLDEEAAGAYAHPACHSDEAVLYNTGTSYDVSGGWHDAADYGRYMKTGTKAVNDLLFAFMKAPYLFTDGDSVPNTGNGIPDILDEARYELEWMLKMQEENGAVHIKVVTKRFPKMYYMPNDYWSGLTLMGTETISTADFGGTMAAASIAFRQVDQEFADICLDAAVKAEEYLKAHPAMTAVYNPAGFDCGQYLDESDQDGRFYTEMALYAATMNKDYLYRAENIYAGNPSSADGTGWKDNGFYGSWLFLTSEDAENTEPWLYSSLISRLKNAADTYLYYEQSTAYNVAVNTYKWGCSGTVCDRSILLCMAYDLTGRQEYRQAAVEQLSWLLGRNCLNMSLVTGFGTEYPHDIHCRLTYNTAVELTGTLVAGPDAYYEDPVITDVPYGTPAAKVYLDVSGAYSTNEFAIYYNSAMINLLAFLRA